MYLVDLNEASIWEGTVFQFPGEYPYEKYVDYMVVSYPDTESGFAIYCISGYYAGKLIVCLPLEARDSDNRALSAEWMKRNWNKWIYDGCQAQDVIVIK